MRGTWWLLVSFFAHVYETLFGVQNVSHVIRLPTLIQFVQLQSIKTWSIFSASRKLMSKLYTTRIIYLNGSGSLVPCCKPIHGMVEKLLIIINNLLRFRWFEICGCQGLLLKCMANFRMK